MMKAKLISMELDNGKKDTIINEHMNELKLVKDDNADLNGKVFQMKKNEDDKNEAFDIATGQINSLEEDKKGLLAKLKIYSATIKGLRTQLSSGTSDIDMVDASAKEKEMKNKLNEKSKKLKDLESKNRQLASKLSEYEAKKDDNLKSVEEKFKKINDKLTAKTKDLKKSEVSLKQAEQREKALMESMTEQSKKISELENVNTRLRLMKDQAAEIVDKVGAKKEEPIEADRSKHKMVKCRFENTGVCRQKNDCKDFHPKKTCQAHSKLGSCPLESSCEHRHPYGICYDWEKYGSCFNGDNCRHKHPFDVLRAAAPTTPDHFLGHGSPGGSGGPPPVQPAQWSQAGPALPAQWPQSGQAQAAPWPQSAPAQQAQQAGRQQHDMRGNRW